MTIAHRLAEERRARLAAERTLEMKEAELFAANRKLGRHARVLSDRIEKTEAEVATVRSENKRVKSDLHIANQKVEVAERRLWHSIRTIRDGFAFFDADNVLIGANEAYLGAFDGIEDVQPGITYMEILMIATEEGLVDLEGVKPADWRGMMLDRWNSPDPDPRTIRLWNGAYAKMIDQRGPGGDVVSLALNITDTILYENRLKKARREADASNRAKSSFLANMSHEIRTPMNGIVGMASLLAESDLDEEDQLYVETIRNSGEALLTIINDVLDYSKIEADKLELRPTSFDLEQCVHEVVRLLQPTARDKGLSLLVDYDLFLPTQMTGDPGRIRQILTNILGNAVKFTLKGHVLISVTGQEENGICDLHVTIQDTGIGIPEDKVDHVFGQFNQVEDERNRQFEGTGLGLAITKRLVELMEGQIWVTSELDVGTCFGFQIRLKCDAPMPEIVKPCINHALIVDTDDTNRSILAKQVKVLGMGVTEADSVENAKTALLPDHDLIIIDDELPDSDEFELAEALHNEQPDANILILAQNASLANSDPARAIVSNVLSKPLSRQSLYSALMECSHSPTPSTSDQPVEETVPADDSQEPATVVFRARSRPQTTPEAPVEQITEPQPLEPVTSKPETVEQDPDPIETPPLMRVLAAEDNKTNQLVFRKMLKTANIDLHMAANGIEAVAAVEEGAFDLIFMDISMPKMDGKEATQRIREIESTQGRAHTPIIAMTAHAMDGDEERILAAGLDDYLTKPLKKNLLLDRLSTSCPEGAAPLFQDEG